MMRLTKEQLATVLAALRHWQSNVVEDFDAGRTLIEDGHFADCQPMNCDEIDELCERLNVEGTTHDCPTCGGDGGMLDSQECKDCDGTGVQL